MNLKYAIVLACLFSLSFLTFYIGKKMEKKFIGFIGLAIFIVGMVVGLVGLPG